MPTHDEKGEAFSIENYNKLKKDFKTHETNYEKNLKKNDSSKTDKTEKKEKKK